MLVNRHSRAEGAPRDPGIGAATRFAGVTGSATRLRRWRSRARRPARSRRERKVLGLGLRRPAGVVLQATRVLEPPQDLGQLRSSPRRGTSPGRRRHFNGPTCGAKPTPASISRRCSTLTPAPPKPRWFSQPLTTRRLSRPPGRPIRPWLRSAKETRASQRRRLRALLLRSRRALRAGTRGPPVTASVRVAGERWCRHSGCRYWPSRRRSRSVRPPERRPLLPVARGRRRPP
jgi:hypothetical protein